MIDFGNLEAWFVTGSQHLYGPETLAEGGRTRAADRRGAGGIAVHPGEDRVPAGDDQQRLDS